MQLGEKEKALETEADSSRHSVKVEMAGGCGVRYVLGGADRSRGKVRSHTTPRLWHENWGKGIATTRMGRTPCKNNHIQSSLSTTWTHLNTEHQEFAQKPHK